MIKDTYRNTRKHASTQHIDMLTDSVVELRHIPRASNKQLHCLVSQYSATTQCQQTAACDHSYQSHNRGNVNKNPPVQYSGVNSDYTFIKTAVYQQWWKELVAWTGGDEALLGMLGSGINFCLHISLWREETIDSQGQVEFWWLWTVYLPKTAEKTDRTDTHTYIHTCHGRF